MEFQVNYDGKTVDLFDDDARKKFLDGYVDASLENKLDLEKFLMTEIDDRQRRRGLHCGAPVVGEGDTFAGYRIGAASLEALSSEPREEPPTVINRWYLRNKEGERAEVVIYEKDGKRWHKKQLLNPEPAARFSLLTRSMAQRMRSNPLSAELEARKKLKSIISHVQWYSYELSGVFIEEGRSGVHYFLRKGLPTLACRPKDGDHPASIIAALCTHSFGHFDGTFVGALAPSDEVATNVLFIRADEHLFWKKANQHSPKSIMSGL